MKVAIVYDRVNKWGGAERVLLTLNELFPDAPLYTAVYDRENAPWAKVFPKVIPSFLQKIPYAKNNHELLGFLTPIAFEFFDFSEFDLVISVISEAGKGIITRPQTLHICYCLTPTRYLWSGYEDYLNNPSSKLSWIPFYKFIAKPILNYVKLWDKIASQRPDEFIAISQTVRDRIKKYYDRNSEIIFPPVDTKKFQKLISMTRERKKSGEYYLFVSRLIPYKKADLAIKVFNQIGKRLIIVGTGSEEKKLKRLAGDNIEFINYVSDEELAKYYQNAKALIFPGEEDFGIVMVESLASGTPVIAYKKGGALDIIKDGKTGMFFEKQNVASLTKALTRFNNVKFVRKDLIKSANRFSKEKFTGKFKQVVEMYTKNG